MMCDRDSVHAMKWLYLIMLVVVSACGKTAVGPMEGQRAPLFEAQRMNGDPFNLAEIRGRPSVLIFWASWCGPCRQEAPDVVRVAKSYGSQVNIVGINAGERGEVAKKAAREMGITWPVVMDADGAIQSQYQVTGIPLVLVLDAEGRVRHRNNGVPSDIHRLLDGLLG